MTKIEMAKRMIRNGDCYGILCTDCPIKGCVQTMRERRWETNDKNAVRLVKEWLENNLVEGKQRIFDFEEK